MAIKIVVDTKSRSNPSNNKREYVLNTHPLFKIDNVTDILKIEKNLSPDAQQRLRDSWEKLYKGASNSGKLVILEEGMSYEKMREK